MSVNKSCPIVYKSVDKHITRLNAFIVFSFLLLFIFSYNPVLLILITVDFIVRVFFGLKYSIICFIIKRALSFSGVKPHLTNAGPKIFAAKIGLILSVMSLIFYFSGFMIITYIITATFLVATGMDAIFNYCIACKIYPYYQKMVSN